MDLRHPPFYFPAEPILEREGEGWCHLWRPDLRSHPELADPRQYLRLSGPRDRFRFATRRVLSLSEAGVRRHQSKITQDLREDPRNDLCSFVVGGDGVVEDSTPRRILLDIRSFAEFLPRRD